EVHVFGVDGGVAAVAVGAVDVVDRLEEDGRGAGVEELGDAVVEVGEGDGAGRAGQVLGVGGDAHGAHARGEEVVAHVGVVSGPELGVAAGAGVDAHEADGDVAHDAVGVDGDAGGLGVEAGRAEDGEGERRGERTDEASARLGCGCVWVVHVFMCLRTGESSSWGPAGRAGGVEGRKSEGRKPEAGGAESRRDGSRRDGGAEVGRSCYTEITEVARRSRRRGRRPTGTSAFPGEGRIFLFLLYRSLFLVRVRRSWATRDAEGAKVVFFRVLRLLRFLSPSLVVEPNLGDEF